MRGKSIYADLYVKLSHRAARTPRVARPWRPRVIAWAGPTAFMRDRFYELDSWYKARIHKPELLPELHLIDPDYINYTLGDRLKVIKHRNVNIGFKLPQKKVEKAQLHSEETMERLSRRNLLKINIDEDIFNDLNLMEHYNIFEDMFSKNVYFFNTQKFNVLFNPNSKESELEGEIDDHSLRLPANAVHFGNIIREMSSTPSVSVQRLLDWSKGDGSGSGFSSLVMLNLDGDALNNYGPAANGVEPHRQQILHWFAGNIPDSRPSDEISGFDDLVPYLQPLPFHGTGYHRIVFLLMRHSEYIDFRPYFKKTDFNELPSRLFDVNLFIKHYEDVLTPSSIRFCQTKWNESCDHILHEMGLKSPRYWYDWNEPLKPEQKEFPMKPMPFNHYLNMFRPPEKVRREVARERLELLMNQEETEEENVEKPEFPDIFYKDNVKSMPSWVHKETIRRNTGSGPYSALYQEYVNPAEQHEDD